MSTNNRGYIYPPGQSNPKCIFKPLHVIIAEKALGKPLPKGTEVHHVDEDVTNNLGSNLVICPNKKYHALLHQRTRAYDACGHADWRKCQFCQIYDDPKHLVLCSNSSMCHKACRNADQNRRRRAKNAVS